MNITKVEFKDRTWIRVEFFYDEAIEGQWKSSIKVEQHLSQEQEYIIALLIFVLG